MKIESVKMTYIIKNVEVLDKYEASISAFTLFKFVILQTSFYSLYYFQNK